MPVTFKVSDIPSDGGLLPAAPAARLLEPWTQGRIEATADLPTGRVMTREHSFLGAARLAFSEHLPLVLRPDDVWLVLVQGFAQHVQHNAKRLRSRLVGHQGEVNLVVTRDEFERRSSDNDWAGVLPEFRRKLQEHIGERHDLIVGAFSTTGELDRLVATLSLMDVMQSYFRYEVVTLCGIPEVTLEGTVDDWDAVRHRARALAEFDLDWWTTALEPALGAFVEAAAGRPDRRYWQSFYKWNESSGGPYVSGWVNALFPYIQMEEKAARTRNPFAIDWAQDVWGGGPRSDQFPNGLRQVPLTWDYRGTKIPMRFHAGFLGVRQDPLTLAVAPQLGWALEDLSSGTA